MTRPVHGGARRDSGPGIAPAATVRAIRKIARSLARRPAQLREWYDQDLRDAIDAIDAASRPFRDELERRADELEALEEAAADAAAWRQAKGE